MAAELTDEQIITTALSMGMWGVQGVRPNGETFITGMGDGVIKTVRALLATQGAEPVGFVHYRSTGLGSTVREAVLTPAGLELPDGALLYTAPPPTAEVVGLLERARRVVQEYAARNPKHDYLGRMQDPCGAHALLIDIDAAIQSDQAQAGKGE